MGISLRFELSDLSVLSLQQLVSYSLGFPTLVLVSAEVSAGISASVSCDFLYLLVCLSNLGGSSLPCDFASLKI